MKTVITAQQIFAANQILTLEIAKQLIGIKIATTSPEYRSNSVDVRIGTILNIESEWDLASKEDHSHLDGGKYATRQDYWTSYMSQERVNNAKKRLKLVTDSNLYGTCERDFFFGSDSDREIYFIKI